VTDGEEGTWSTPTLWSKFSVDGTSVTIESGYPQYLVTDSADTPGDDQLWQSSWNAIKD